MTAQTEASLAPASSAVIVRRIRAACSAAVALGVCAALVAFASDGPGAQSLRLACIYVAALLIWAAVVGDEVATLLGQGDNRPDGALSGAVHVIGCFAVLVVGLLNYFTDTWAAGVPAICLFLLAWALAALAQAHAGSSRHCRADPTSHTSEGEISHD